MIFRGKNINFGEPRSSAPNLYIQYPVENFNDV